MGAIDPAGKLDAVDDIAPLVRPAHLEAAGRAARQLQKIIGLQDHVIEFEEGERLLPIQPHLHRIEAQHPVDREMLADIAQERDIFEAVQPLRIVEHDGVGRPVPEGQEAGEHALDAGDILRDQIGGEQLARFILKARVADLAGAAAHQDDGLVSRALQLAQHHDRHQMPDMQRRRGRIETDIARHNLLRGERIQPFRVGQLVDITPLVEQAQQIGCVVAHGRRP